MNIFKSFVYYILSIQEKLLAKRLSKTLDVKVTSKKKQIYNNGCTLTIDSISETERLRLEEELKLILKSNNYNPKEILDYVEKHDTKCFYIKSTKILDLLEENEGFIYPQTGFKALILSLLTRQGLKCKTSGCFVLKKGEINLYYFLYHIYNWYTFKNKISGLDASSIKILNKYLFSSSEEDMKKLSLTDIYMLKDAIKQDKEAINFVIKLCKEVENYKNAFNKIKDNGANI